MATPGNNRDELVAQFVGLTNAPPSEAEHLLEAAGWDLGTAAQLHFEGVNAAAASTSTAPAVQIPDELPDLDDFMANARGSRAAAALAATAAMVGEDGVRVADSVKRERLFDTRHARQPRVSMSHVGPDIQQMPFGDLDPDAAKRTGPGLDSIYQPPTEILSNLQLSEYATCLALPCVSFFCGILAVQFGLLQPFDVLYMPLETKQQLVCRIKNEAEKEDKWILFNLQARLPFDLRHCPVTTSSLLTAVQ